MDIDKFRSHQSQGIFGDDLDGYSAWADWANRIRMMVRALDLMYAHMLSGVPKDKLALLLPICGENPESAIHVLAQEMTQVGASWTILAMLREVSDTIDAGFPEMTGVEKSFHAQALRVTSWYERLGGKLENEAEVQPGFTRCGAKSVHGEGGVEIECHGDGVRVLVLDGENHGTAVLLGREPAERLLEALSTMSSAVEKERVSIFLGMNQSEDNQEGLRVRPSCMGEPYRETAEFTVVAPGYATLSSAEIRHHDLADIVNGMMRMLYMKPEAVLPVTLAF